eukprot:11203926-Lingulodinium_polyedra.AAC.1
MPPKGSKKTTEPTSVAQTPRDIKVELVEGERDAQNLDVHSMVQAAWTDVATEFPGITSENPLK